MAVRDNKYRPEIDGLRALAILPVILFHAEFSWFSGGYVGVDVFFVISGYLITRIIYREIESRSFSLLRFYERRARRILPALFLVMTATIPFAYLWMLPSEMKDFGQSLVAANWFISNLLFWLESGYFATVSELKPLLHTWTLSIEEQYYVFYPLLLLALKNASRKSVIAVVSFIAVLSLVVAEFSSRRYISANFYLIHTRAWELAIGSLVALYLAKNKFNARFANFVSFVGLVAIVIAVLFFDASTPFPGLYALLPVVGAAAIVLSASEKTLVGKILSRKVFIKIGLISYSLYLWHHPLFALARMRKMEALNPVDYAVLIAMSFVLAFISCKYVETPFRRTLLRSQKSMFAFSFAGIFLFTLAGGGLYIAEQNKVAKETAPKNCHWLSDVAHVNCFGDLEGASKRVVLWGDSYADMVSGSFGQVVEEKGHHFLPIISHSCPSLKGVVRNEAYRLGIGFKSRCLKHVNSAMNIIEGYAPDIVILSSSYIGYSNEMNPKNQLPILLDSADEEKTGIDVVSGSLVDTVSFFNTLGAKVFILEAHPTLDKFQTRLRRFKVGGGRQALSLDLKEAKRVNTSIQVALKNAGLEYQMINPYDIFCSDHNAEQKCNAMSDAGELLLFDGSHLSSIAAKKLAQQLSAML